MKLSTSLSFPLSSTNTEEVRKWAQLYLPVGNYDQKTGKNKPTQPPGKPENPGNKGGNGGNQGGGNGGGGSSGPPGQAFSATPLFYAPFQTTLVPTISVAGTPNYAAANSRGTVRDWENNLRRVKTGEARFTGARRVENLVAGSSFDLTNVSWTKDNSGVGSAAPVVTANFATDPLGGSTATRLQVNMGSDAANGYSRAFQGFNYTTGAPGTGAAIRAHRASVWMKANAGTPTVCVICSTDTSINQAASVTLDSTWRRYTTPVNSANASTTIWYIIVGLEGTAFGTSGLSSSADILVWGAQLENVAGQSNQNPGEYVSVGSLSSPYHGAFVDGVKYFNTLNGNTVASNIVTEATGAGIFSNINSSQYTTDALGPFGLLLEQNQNNTGNVSAETAYNATYTTKTNLTVTDKAVSNPMGETGGAAIIENGVNGDHRLGQFGAIASSTTICMSCFVKPNTRTQIRLRGDPDGVNYCDGEFSLVGSGSVLAVTPHGTSTIQGSGVDVYANGWYRVWFIATYASTAAGFSFSHYPMVSQNSTYTGTNGVAAFWLWGTLISSVQETDLTSPPSYSWDARGPDQLSYTFAGNADATVGTAYAECYSKWSTPAATRFIIGFGVAANNQMPLIVSSGDAATTLRVRDGTNNVQKTGLTTMATAFRKNASSWATTGSKLFVTGGGAAPASGSFDGDIGSTAIGIGMATTYSGSNFQGHIRNVKIYNVAADANQLASITT